MWKPRVKVDLRQTNLEYNKKYKFKSTTINNCKHHSSLHNQKFSIINNSKVCSSHHHHPQKTIVTKQRFKNPHVQPAPAPWPGTDSNFVGFESYFLTSWEVKIGESVECGDNIAYVESGPVAFEVRANTSGITNHHCIPKGEEFKYNSVLCTISKPQTSKKEEKKGVSRKH
jgi:biotin carboxyl carrier protein